jgi:hypothetical protein
MKISSRIELILHCGGESYFLAGGEDHRKSLPMMLKIARNIVTGLYYCGDDPGPVLFWDFEDFCRCLLRNTNGVPQVVHGGWEFPYVTVTDCGGEPASTLLNAFLPKFKKELLKYGIDPRAYKCEVQQWDIEAPPDDSAEHDFMEEEESEDEQETDAVFL